MVQEAELVGSVGVRGSSGDWQRIGFRFASRRTILYHVGWLSRSLPSVTSESQTCQESIALIDFNEQPDGSIACTGFRWDLMQDDMPLGIIRQGGVDEDYWHFFASGAPMNAGQLRRVTSKVQSLNRKRDSESIEDRCRFCDGEGIVGCIECGQVTECVSCDGSGRNMDDGDCDL